MRDIPLPSVRFFFGRLAALWPGLADAGASSLAGFASTLYAVHYLEDHTVGAYALYSYAFNVGSLIPQNMLFLPLQVSFLSDSGEALLRSVPRALLLGSRLAALAAVCVLPAGLFTARQVPAETMLALGLTAAAATMVSSLQDHVRASFHLAGDSRCASAVSVVYAAAVFAVILYSVLWATQSAWVPFGSIVAGNVCSIAFGLAMLPRIAGPKAPLPPLRSLFRQGAKFVPIALATEGTTLISGAFLAVLASPSALGSSEGARTLARPITVMSLGLDRQLGPALMRAGRNGDRARAWTTMRVWVAVLLVASVVMMALIVGVPGMSHPLKPLLPIAYRHEGFAVAVTLTTAISAIVLMPRRVLIGAGEAGTVLGIAGAAAVTRILVVALTATTFSAYAMPLGVLAASVVGGALVVPNLNRAWSAETGAPLSEPRPVRSRV